MSTPWTKKVRWFVWMSALALVLAPGCGDDEEPAPADVAPGEREAPATPGPGNEAEPAAELQLFKIAPADPLMVAVFPSIQSLETQAVSLATRLAPPEIDVKAMVAEWSSQWAMSLGLPAADTPSQALVAMGVDPAKPIGLYIDTDAFSQRYLEEVQRLKAEAEAAEAATPEPGTEEPIDEPVGTGTPEAAPAEGAGAELEDDAVPEKEVELDEATEDAEIETEDLESEMEENDEGGFDHMSFDMTTPFVNPIEAAGLPAIAVAFTVLDADKAVAQLDSLLQMSPEAASFTKQEVDAHGLKLTVYDPDYCSYFVHGNTLVVGNEQAWLEQVAGGVHKPGPLPEGLPKPPYDDEQMVVAIRSDQMEPLIYAMNLGNTLLPGQAGAMAEAQLATWDEMKKFYAGTDPWFATLRWSDTAVSMDTRLNLDKHAALKEVVGAGKPMRHASVLPKSTMAVMSINLTPEMKAAIEKYWIDGIPPELLQDPAVAGPIMGAKQAIATIQGEITLGVTGVENSMPTGVLMVDVADPQMVLQQLGMLVMISTGAMPEMPRESGLVNEVQIPDMMSVYYTVLDKTLMLGTSRAELEAAVAGLKVSNGSGYFASLTPPLNEQTPRYFLISLRPELAEVLTAFQGGSGTDPTLQQLLKTVKEVRMTTELDSPWWEQTVALYLNAP